MNARTIRKNMTELEVEKRTSLVVPPRLQENPVNLDTPEFRAELMEHFTRARTAAILECQTPVQ